jgi:ketosteroid isomerase-like protein
MENDRIQAGVRKDVDAIAAVTADDYVMIDFEGKVRNKAATLERIKSSEIRLQSNSLDEVDVRIYGNTAMVTGRATPKGTISGKDFSRPIRYTRVYVKKRTLAGGLVPADARRTGRIRPASTSAGLPSGNNNGLLHLESFDSLRRNRNLVAPRLARRHLECNETKPLNTFTQSPSSLWRFLVF